MATQAPQERRRGGIFGGGGRLNDINEDGKRNLGDTWLGDALGLDGSFGVQGPGLRDSWHGARRRSGVVDEPATDTPPEADTEVTYGPQNGRQGPRGAGRVATGPVEGESTPSLSAPGDAPTVPTVQSRVTGQTTEAFQRAGRDTFVPIAGVSSLDDILARVSAASASAANREATLLQPTPTYTYSQWQGMSRGDRERAGLPTSVVGGEIAFSRMTQDTKTLGGEWVPFEPESPRRPSIPPEGGATITPEIDRAPARRRPILQRAGSGSNLAPSADRPEGIPVLTLRPQLASILGPQSSTVKNLEAAFSGRAGANATQAYTTLIQEVQALPSTRTRETVLSELYRMRDATRGN